MKMGALKAISGGVATAALALVISAAPASAQSSDDCRCVDRDGNAIERCSCFRAPNIQGLLAPFGLTDSKPRLGISVDAEQSARRDADGALVTDVLEDGPADRAGIRRGDMITSIDGHSLFEPLAADAEEDFDLDRSVPVQRLLAIAAELEPGTEVVVEYSRDGASRQATVEAEDLSDSWGNDFTVRAPRFDADELRGQLRGFSRDARDRSDRARSEFRWREQGDRPLFFAPGAGGDVRVFGGGSGSAVVIDRYRGLVGGLELVALNPQLGSYFGAEAGVLVADAEEDSELGLRPGDVVLRIGDRSVGTPDRMRRILQSYGEDEEITFHIRRDGRDTTVTGTLGG